MENLGIDGSIMLSRLGWRWTESLLAQRQIMGFSVCSNEPSNSIKLGKYLIQEFLTIQRLCSMEKKSKTVSACT
jgi:hypothetical protein